MQMEIDSLSVGEIIELYKNSMLRANPEYQRGIVWSATQKKKLIDSVFRGYPLPLIYLHHIRKAVAGMQREDLEIVDGQQRISALHDFIEGGFKLLDPVEDDLEGKFPNFLKHQACPWAHKDFRSLDSSLREKLLNTELSIAKITTDNANEVRDLFVRLQAGLALNPQETRDAWPGDFTDFILWLGGKPQVVRYKGHRFFRDVLRMKPNSDRGKARTLAAQIACLYFTRREKNSNTFIDIKSSALDDFYYAHIDFDKEAPEAKRLIDILDKLSLLFSDGKRPKLRGHDAIHLVLLTDSLWDEYTRSWEGKIALAFDKFAEALAYAKNNMESANEYWLRYGQLTRVASDKADTIRRRHEFYSEKMLEFLQPLELKDPKRLFGPLEREVIYYRDKKLCAVCETSVVWDDAEIHHVKEHQDGGKTILDNGVLVHRHCHPKGAAAKEFRHKQI